MRMSAPAVLRRTLHTLSAILALTLAQPVQSQTALDGFLQNLKTMRAEFSQVVTDGSGRQVQQAAGTLVIVRPGRFRWELTPDGAGATAQLMISDGRNLWFYDRDLEQVSVRPADSALTATPASLLSGNGDIRELFTVKTLEKNQARKDGLEWVSVTPRNADADFREARLAFAGSDLKRMDLKDKLGQTVELEFRVSRRNVPVAEAEVIFTPPAGADVIGTPLP
jgi:outer membrane lipoprotein carrier protein